MIWLCLAIAAISAPDDGAALRVVTYNIHHAEGTDGKVDLERIASVIKALHPDVVCLQEVDSRLARTGRVNMPDALGKLLDMTGVFGANSAAAATATRPSRGCRSCPAKIHRCRRRRARSRAVAFARPCAQASARSTCSTYTSA
jgi:endonuclease/exonuclease/phosphatase family metal-dependent hydrolase